MTPERVVVFRGLSSPEQVFFRRVPDGAVEWSSDPRDLLGGRLPEFSREALWRSCRGEDVFVYPGMGTLRAGELAALKLGGAGRIGPEWFGRRERFDRPVPPDLPRRATLRTYAGLLRELLEQEVRPYAADRGPTGVLLSGGVDSALVLDALVRQGAEVVAYHMGTDDPAADESAYARAVCARLGVPLVTVPRATAEEDYFAGEGGAWDFPHPYNHVWLRSLERVADRVAADGVRVLLSGLEGDMLFGPLRYGLYDVLAGDVRRREKYRMLQGLLATRWELRRILRSARPSYSLYADPEAYAEVELGSDFLVPVPGAAPEEYAVDFAPQEQTLGLTLWRPRGIVFGKPLGCRALRGLAARLPDAYRVIPYGGRTVDKPVLRLAAADRLPPEVWRHYGRTWLASPDESWCLRHPGVLERILGDPRSRLAAAGVVDQERLAGVLGNPAALRRNAESLLCSAMVELFLRDLERKTAVSQ
ncbi:asparagine synthase C-terminal domain-containing protein [Streptomyces sp. ODS28]|uniref:asparagine synthase C-terminal domain-containing protein n=1 Tax=Streptomyces sp. ODS28 TaxID=3136688 RepID=UPI0031E6F389